MRRASALWEVFVLKFEDALGRYRKRRLTAEEAGELLGMSGRHFRRLVERYDDDGQEGLRDRRLGKPSPRRAPASELAGMQQLYRELYGDFTIKHFHEQLQKRHGYRLCYTVTRLALQAAGLARKTKRGGPHRKKRERRPLPGMLLFQDGSTHRWIPGLDHDLDLIVTLDDATGAIYSAILVAEEGTASSFLGLAETIAAKGLFRGFYTDRGSHYFHTPKAGGKVDKSKLTQVGRAPRVTARGLASLTSPPTRPKPAGEWNASSARCRSDCRPSCAWPRSTRARPPTATSESGSCPSTTPASRRLPPSRARLSWLMLAGRSMTCSACRKTARSDATTVSNGRA